ncbi:MAG: LysM peptidoglycan-binding domain-containing protein [Chthoniobacteraceae bacterium]
MGAFIAKTIFILLLAAAIFGGAWYYTDKLFLKPQEALVAEKNAPATPLPPDPALPEFIKAAELMQSGDLLGARDAFTRFVEQNPHSLKLDAAKDLLGTINTDIFLSTKPAPEKQVYVVKRGDVLNKVARITKTTPELIMRANGMTGIMLRIDQRLYYAPAEFSLVIDKQKQKIVLLNRGKFFKQYPITTLPPAKKAAPGPVVKKLGKVLEKIAWGPSGARVIFTDKEYAEANFWVSFSVSGHTLYSDPDPSSGQKPNKPPTGGIGVAPEAVAELAIMLTKGNPVTIEN